MSHDVKTPEQALEALRWHSQAGPPGSARTITPAGIETLGVCADVLAKVVEENKALQGTTYCAFCGERFPLDGTAATAVAEHIKTCPKHPMREVEADRNRLDSIATRQSVELREAEHATRLEREKLHKLADLILEGDKVLPLLRSVGIQVKSEGEGTWCATYHNTFKDPQASAIGYGDTPMEAADVLLCQLARVDLDARAVSCLWREWASNDHQFPDPELIDSMSCLGIVVDKGLGLCDEATDWGDPDPDPDPDQSPVHTLDSLAHEAMRVADLLGITVARKLPPNDGTWAATMPGFDLDGEGNLIPIGQGPTAMCAVQALVGELVRRARGGTVPSAVDRIRADVARMYENLGRSTGDTEDSVARSVLAQVLDVIDGSKPGKYREVEGILERSWRVGPGDGGISSGAYVSNVTLKDHHQEGDVGKRVIVLVPLEDPVEGEPRTCGNCGLPDKDRIHSGARCYTEGATLDTEPGCDLWEPKPEAYPEEGRFDRGCEG